MKIVISTRWLLAAAFLAGALTALVVALSFWALTVGRTVTGLELANGRTAQPIEVVCKTDGEKLGRAISRSMTAHTVATAAAITEATVRSTGSGITNVRNQSGGVSSDTNSGVVSRSQFNDGGFGDIGNQVRDVQEFVQKNVHVSIEPNIGDGASGTINVNDNTFTVDGSGKSQTTTKETVSNGVAESGDEKSQSKGTKPAVSPSPGKSEEPVTLPPPPASVTAPAAPPPAAVQDAEAGSLTHRGSSGMHG